MAEIVIGPEFVPGPIPLLAAEELRFVVEEPEFERLAAEELGDAGTPADGFDAAFRDAEAGLASVAGLTAGIDDELGRAEVGTGELWHGLLDDGAAAAAETIAQGDAARAALESELPVEAVLTLQVDDVELAVASRVIPRFPGGRMPAPRGG